MDPLQKKALFDDEMNVLKRDGNLEIVSFDKILTRIKKIGTEVDIKINYTSLAMKVIDQLYDGISTTKIDELTAEQCASLSSTHPDYNILAGRIIVSNHQKNTESGFSKVMKDLYHYKDIHGLHSPLVSENLYKAVCVSGDIFDATCNYDRDYLIDYFGFKTLERAYLMRIDGKIVERPQHMWMRVAIGIHLANFENDSIVPSVLQDVFNTYEYMSKKYFTHATPTLFNAGTPRPQLSSCFLIAMEDDSVDGIYNTLKDCAKISKWAGGIGLHIHNVRASGSHIRGTNGKSNGIVPMLKVFNNTAKYIDQCVHPSTIIYTTEGPKEIQHCTIGETGIFNLKGDSEIIQNVLEHEYYGDMLEIESMHSLFPLKITLEHPVYVLPRQPKGINFKVIKNRIEKKIIDFEWKDAKDLTEDDFMVYPIPTYSFDNKTFSQDDCYMYGIILGDGCVNNEDNNTGYVSTHTENKSHISNFIKRYLEEKLVKYTVLVDGNTTRIRWNKTLHLPFRYNDCYDETKTKRLHSRWLNLPIEKSKFILKGLLHTDGCIGSKELVFDSTSLNLIESVRFICLKLGLLTSGYIRDRIGEKHDTVKGIIENKKISYCLRVPRTREICDLLDIQYDEKQFFKFLKHDNFIMSRIQKISKTTYSGILYDLQMERQHDYLIHNGLVHNGGGRRNGSFAIYLEPWHADIDMFLQMRKNHGDEELKARDLFYALWIPDLFMERIKANGKWTLMCPDECPGLSDVYGEEFVTLYESYELAGKGRSTVQARDLWFKVLDAQMETGTPYLLFKDACNKKSNQKNIGTIKSSNLCVAPETLILTENGHIEIGDLENQTVKVWNGEEFTEVIVVKTGVDQELIDVYTDDGMNLTCTPYHKFYIQYTYSQSSVEKVDAKDLKPGDKIIKCEYPVIDGIEDMLYPYTHGFFCGDGTYRNHQSDRTESPCVFNALEGHHFCGRHLDNETSTYLDENDIDEYIGKCKAISYKKIPIVCLYDVKKDLLPFIEQRMYSNEENNNRICVSLPLDIPEKFQTPSDLCSLKTKLDWFAGYCDADGSISHNGDNEQLQVGSINFEFLQKVKLMLQTCGINPKIKLSSNRDKSWLPDGRGGHRFFDVKPMYRLLITSIQLYDLIQLGFKPHRLVIAGNKPQRGANQFIKILKIENNNRIDDTFCFTEPKRGTGIFNGIITGQCTEVVQYSDHNETAVCNLASIALPTFVLNSESPVFDYETLHKITKIVTYNLNRVIDINYYPTEKTRLSNMKHRPIGIGVQGLADVFMMMGLPFIGDESKEINKKIFETIYHAALECSCEMAEKDGHYDTFPGSPASKGILQFDMWADFQQSNDRYDWPGLKERIMKYGLRNSLLVAPMPTASTSQILGFNECIEPITSNIYSRRTNAGEFILANKYMLTDLIKLNLWNDKMKNNIIANHGSIQHIETIPQEIRDKYKTVWEMQMRHLIDMAADRGVYICQSQSLNLWLEDPNYNSLTSMHFYSWSKGLKTGIYYLRRRGRHQAQQFTIEPEKTVHNTSSVEEDEICEMCSS